MRRTIKRVTVLLGILFILFLTDAMADGKNRALLIGCDQFLSASDTSPASSTNVLQMAEALSGGSMNLQHLVTRRTGISGISELQEMIAEAFGGSDDQDTNYIYLSTHGIWKSGDPEMTLLLSDGFREQEITASELYHCLEKIRGTKVLILDMCHAGAIIGKGVSDRFFHMFSGKDYKILCSSGGAQESWFWKGTTPDGQQFTGGGYFSNILANGISIRTGFASDSNVDGIITFSELKKYLRQMHGASVVQTYPEEDDFAFLSYDAESVKGRHTGYLGDVFFENDLLSQQQEEIHFSYTVYQTLRMAYQIVYLKDGRWDFEHASLVYDTGEMFGIFGDAAGYLTPGIKERTLRIEALPEEAHGYVLVQMIVETQDTIEVAASHVFGIVSSDCTVEMEVKVGKGFAPETGEELGIIIQHNIPVLLTIYVEAENGVVIRRLCSRMMTRPEQMIPEASSVFWDGRNSSGNFAEKGRYRIHVQATVNGINHDCYTGYIQVE